MNNIWSDHVQGIMTLYLSRKLRFDDVFFAQYDPLFGLDHNKEMRILEIGCGPGALAEALHRWYPRAQITAIDRDSNFIAFAQKNIKGIDFVEGDATHLPFENESFDVTISNTVQEHIDPGVKAFKAGDINTVAWIWKFGVNDHWSTLYCINQKMNCRNMVSGNMQCPKPSSLRQWKSTDLRALPPATPSLT